MRFHKLSLCDTYINHRISCRLGRTPEPLRAGGGCHSLVPPPYILILTQDTVIVITIWLIIHV